MRDCISKNEAVFGLQDIVFRISSPFFSSRRSYYVTNVFNIPRVYLTAALWISVAGKENHCWNTYTPVSILW